MPRLGRRRASTSGNPPVEGAVLLKQPPLAVETEQVRAVLVAHPKRTVARQCESFGIETASQAVAYRLSGKVIPHLSRTAVTAGGRQAAEKISGSIPKRHRSDRLERIARKPELSHPRSELRQCENLALRRRPVHVGSPVGQEPKTGIGRIVTHCRAVPANKDRCSVRLRTYRFKRYRHPFGQGGGSAPAPAPPAQRSGRNRPEHSLVCNNRFHTFSIWDRPCDLPV